VILDFFFKLLGALVVAVFLYRAKSRDRSGGPSAEASNLAGEERSVAGDAPAAVPPPAASFRDGGERTTAAPPAALSASGGDARMRERAETAELTSPLTRPGLEPGPVAHNPPDALFDHGPAFLRLIGEGQ
jgi:hypothetical protein